MNSEQKLILSGAATVALRPRACVQFGLDSASAGIIDCDDMSAARKMAEIIRACHQPITVAGLLHRLREAKFDSNLSRAVVEDLVTYKILTALTAPPAVAIVGNSPLARTITSLLHEDHWRVYTKDPGANIADFVQVWGGHACVICVDTLLESPAIAKATRGITGINLIQAAIVDGRGWIGPVMVHGDGACPMCAELYRIDRDPQWRSLLAQQLSSRPTTPPATIAATAAEVVSLAGLLSKYSPAPPGTTARNVEAGEVTVIEPYSGRFSRSIMHPHRWCDVCFSAERT